MSNQDKVFEQHPSLERYFKTSDGTAFYKKDHANAHARSLKSKTVQEIENPNPKSGVSKPVISDTSKEGKDSKKNKGSKGSDGLTNMEKAQKRAEEISKLDTIEAVEKALKGETSKTVKKAGEDTIKSLKLAAVENAGSGEDNTGIDEEE